MNLVTDNELMEKLASLDDDSLETSVVYHASKHEAFSEVADAASAQAQVHQRMGLLCLQEQERRKGVKS